MRLRPAQVTIRAFVFLRTSSKLSADYADYTDETENGDHSSWSSPHSFQSQTLICGIGVICGQSLPVNPKTIVTTDSREVTKAARLLFLRWINAKLTGAHVIEKIPNLRDDVGTYLLPLVIREHTISLGVNI